jgi:hypothetical protein
VNFLHGKTKRYFLNLEKPNYIQSKSWILRTKYTEDEVFMTLSTTYESALIEVIIPINGKRSLNPISKIYPEYEKYIKFEKVGEFDFIFKVGY